MPQIRFGRMQHQIMQVLWSRKRASARDITDALNKEEVVAHSTVQTLLRKLEVKGAVGHEVEERTFVFFPLVEEQRAVRSATRELVDRVFGGSFSGLMAHLLENEKIPPGELKQIRKLIDERKP
jgi:BlaI family transcriptional regulator, penicillinase repressor